MTATTWFGLNRISSSADALTDEHYKFGGYDRDLIDALLKLGAESHVHSGTLDLIADPTVAPSLDADVTEGNLQVGSTAYYKYTWIDQFGLETLPSDSEGFVVQGIIPAGTAPGLTAHYSGGSLSTGPYYYAITCYDTTDTNEGLSAGQAFVNLSVTSVGRITVDMGSLPAGVTGYNIYRKKPGNPKFYWLTSTTSTSYIDTGSVFETTSRVLPTSANVSGASQSIEVTIPALPTNATGWRLYRSYSDTAWDGTWIAEDDGLTYVDSGTSPMNRTPPSVRQSISPPSKIQLTDSAEVQGTVPMGRVSGFPFIVERRALSFDLTPVGDWPHAWFCEFESATILGARINMDYGTTSDNTFEVDILLESNATTPNVYSIFDGPTPVYPIIYSGDSFGDFQEPQTWTINRGDRLIVSPFDSCTDYYTVVIYLVAHGFSQSLSHVPGSNIGIIP
jgi:hypothetical protein